MAVNQSFTGKIANPIVEARIERSYSANALAKRLGLSRQYLSRAEQGTYASLNPALTRWAAEALNIPVVSVTRRYVQFQRAQRSATLESVGPHKLNRNGNEPENVTFERWRSGYFASPTAFAIAFCVHPDSVSKYEEGIQKTMPGQIRIALSETNLLGSDWESGEETNFGPQRARSQTAL